MSFLRFPTKMHFSKYPSSASDVSFTFTLKLNYDRTKYTDKNRIFYAITRSDKQTGQPSVGQSHPLIASVQFRQRQEAG